MRNARGPRKLGRTTPHRKAMLRNLVTSVLEHERVTTTDARAKEARPLTERVITYGKRGDLHSRRKAMKIVRSKAVVRKVFDSVARRFAERPGGYTRIIKLGRRAGDGAHLSIIELLPEKKPAKAATSKGKKPGRKAGARAKGADAAPKKGSAAGKAKPAAKKAAKKKPGASGEKKKTKKD